MIVSNHTFISSRLPVFFKIGEAQLSELVNEFLRNSELFVTDAQVTALLGCGSLDGKCLIAADERYLTFSEFVALYRKNVALGNEKDAEIM